MKTKLTKQVRIVLKPHVTECAYFNGFNNASSPWCLPEHRYLPFDSIGRRRRSGTSSYIVFQCGDTSCDAQLAVLEYELLVAVGLMDGPGRNLGSPEPAGRELLKGKGE